MIENVYWDSCKIPLLLLDFNPFQSNFSANRILPSSYLFWAGKRLVDYLSLSYSFKREKHRETERVQPALSVG
jgi:hypothetical protein